MSAQDFRKGIRSCRCLFLHTDIVVSLKTLEPDCGDVVSTFDRARVPLFSLHLLRFQCCGFSFLRLLVAEWPLFRRFWVCFGVPLYCFIAQRIIFRQNYYGSFFVCLLITMLQKELCSGRKTRDLFLCASSLLYRKGNNS